MNQCQPNDLSFLINSISKKLQIYTYTFYRPVLMEEKPYSTIQQLFKKYQLNNLGFVCQCKNKMELLCTNDCKEPALHCQNTECKYSNEKHQFCRAIRLQGLTKLLENRFNSYKQFVQMFQKVEQDFIARIRIEREKTFSKFIFREFQDEQIVTLQNLFVRKNVDSVKGIHMEEVYKKLLHEQESKKKNYEQIQQYQNQFKRIQMMINQQRKYIGIQTHKLLYKKSNIIDCKQKQEIRFISNCLNDPKELKLLFRASEHQFSAAKFHQICNDIPNLLVLVKTEFGKVIGGFNYIGWKDGGGQYFADNENKCFIFSATLRQKMDLIQSQNAISNNRQWGPIFGSGEHDIYLSDKCNKNKNSGSGFPSTYNFASKPYTQKEQTKRLFSGSPTGKFGVAEYEVFLVKK